jgi:hypothetical protein
MRFVVYRDAEESLQIYKVRIALSRRLAVARILAVVGLGELGCFALFAPDLPTSPLGMLAKVGVPLREVAVDRCFGVLDSLVSRYCG